jgi:alanyl-tRNA synthetase
LRFDFSHNEKLTPEQIAQVETWVNEQISRGLVRSVATESYEEAIAAGALAFFKERYPEKVTVYTFTDPATKMVISREICGGPHVDTTNGMGKFKIIKEESVAAGIRRVYATLT